MTVAAAGEAFVAFLREVGFLTSVSSISCTSCAGFAAFFAGAVVVVVVVLVADDDPVDFLAAAAAAADPLPRVFVGIAATTSSRTTSATFFGRPLFFAATSDMAAFCISTLLGSISANYSGY
jgi:hypothetical protein